MYVSYEKKVSHEAGLTSRYSKDFFLIEKGIVKVQRQTEIEMANEEPEGESVHETK